MSFTLNPKSAPKSDAEASDEIRLVNVTKRFDDTHAVKDINLTIPHGSYCCLLGPSGCGKTTILRMIAGHEAGTANEIFNRPTTPYVARFMGGQNVLTGTVESASGAMARLRGPRGELFDAPLSPAPTIGTPVSIAIRRDRIHVGRVPGEKAELQPNSVASVLESTEFQGNFVKVNILVEGGGPFVECVGRRIFR
jgi:ABC-type Fe3+/spermidine/putrescine transport system ATPase subunit